MAWIARDAPDGTTPTVPALATHRGELWCIWSDTAGQLYYAVGDNNAFQARLPFPDRGIPVMAELTGVLHTVLVQSAEQMVHYVLDDENETWIPLAALGAAAGFQTTQTPALVAFHNKLFLVFIQNSSLYYSMWVKKPQDETPTWTSPQEVSGISQVLGIPALFVLEECLHVICGSSDGSGEFLGFKYDFIDDVWNACEDVSEGKAASGISATSYGDSAFLAFQENGLDDTSRVVYISEFKNGAWQAQEAVAGQTSSDPPQLAILNGRINCLFNANNDAGGLRWFSRPLLDYSLSTWMANISDDTLLSDITIPGTHDTCAVSNIPFVRTQYLSVTKQMEAGLRFLDLRCRLHADGQLYMYHGGIPINLPRYLKFDAVMDEVFSFFQKASDIPTETVLVSINNDDVSHKVCPSLFYNAVQAHITRRTPYPNGDPRWLFTNTTPTLGAARGKAVLLRRYAADPALSPTEPIGIDLSGWLNNNPDFTIYTATGVTATLQDHWQYSQPLPLADLIASKYGYVAHMLDKAARGRDDEWFLNFTSAVGDPMQAGEVAESHWIAVGAHSNVIGKFVTGMNVSVRKKFAWESGQRGRTRYGVIAMDYPELPKDSDLIAWLIGTNM